jgi:pimeloyl-ACP methyl ester carboxylesterase
MWRPDSPALDSPAGSTQRLALRTVGEASVVADVRRAQEQRGTVLLLHGAGQTRHSWSRTARALQRAGWSSVALDMRGHGESSWVLDADYSLDALVADVATVADLLADEPVLVGASLGGLVCLLAAGERRVGCRGLVLVDVAPRVERAGVQRVK